jgi:hypothetical protein
MEPCEWLEDTPEVEILQDNIDLSPFNPNG